MRKIFGLVLAATALFAILRFQGVTTTIAPIDNAIGQLLAVVGIMVG